MLELLHEASPTARGAEPVSAMAEYDAIAREYRDSKQLPFRHFIERYTLFQILGDVSGATVLDLACGEGFYARRLMRAGARAVVGVDISREMIRLARGEERRNPLGCVYRQGDAGEFEADGAVHLIVANYLLNHARTSAELARFCRVFYSALRPGRRVVGLNENVWNPPSGRASLRKYGIERACETSPPRESDVILYTILAMDGRRFRFKDYYHSPATYDAAFREAGFRDFRWIRAKLDPARRNDPFWDEFMANPPVIAFEATRPE